MLKEEDLEEVPENSVDECARNLIKLFISSSVWEKGPLWATGPCDRAAVMGSLSVSKCGVPTLTERLERRVHWQTGSRESSRQNSPYGYADNKKDRLKKRDQRISQRQIGKRENGMLFYLRRRAADDLEELLASLETWSAQTSTNQCTVGCCHHRNELHLCCQIHKVYWSWYSTIS